MPAFSHDQSPPFNYLGACKVSHSYYSGELKCLKTCEANQGLGIDTIDNRIILYYLVFKRLQKVWDFSLGSWVLRFHHG